MQLHRQPGMPGIENGQHARQQIAAQAFDGHHMQGPALQALQLAQLLRQAPLILKHVLHMPRKCFARGRELQSLRQTLEQRHAQRVFELQQLAVDGRRRYVQLARRFTDGSAAADHVEGFENTGVDVHGAMPSSLRARASYNERDAQYR
ncbi:hypothetical protein D3C71_1819320 [compost metagenome]